MRSPCIHKKQGKLVSFLKIICVLLEGVMNKDTDNQQIQNYDNDEIQLLENELLNYINKTVFVINDGYALNVILKWILGVSESTKENLDDEIIFLKNNNTSFKILSDTLSKIIKNTKTKTITLVLEPYYVDRVYRDSYYFYYSGKHFSYNRFCKRICVFDGEIQLDFFSCTSEYLSERFIGSIVIRPIPNYSIGRTLLNPRYIISDDSCKNRLAHYVITVYGKRLKIDAFPYSMQDGETTSCAETTILNLLDYYSCSYPEYSYLLPSQINAIAEKNSYQRRMPTSGISYEVISKIFCDAGFYPRLYSSSQMSKTKLKKILYYYIESGIPVALGLKINNQNRHSVICIGHSTNYNNIGTELACTYNNTTETALWTCDLSETVNKYCIMDDNKPPYSLCKCYEDTNKYNNRSSSLKLENFEIECMMVPLYKRMILEATDAYDICMTILTHHKAGIKSEQLKNILKDINSCTKNMLNIENIGTIDEPLLIHLFMASSKTFRKNRDKQFNKNNNIEVRNLYNITMFPKFIWVCELSTVSLIKNNLIFGEIIIDATSAADSKANSSIIIHYPHAIARRTPIYNQKQNDIVFNKIINWNFINTFNDNLF